MSGFLSVLLSNTRH